MSLMDVERKIKVQANVNADIGVAEYGGQFYNFDGKEMGSEPLTVDEIGDRVIRMAKSAYGVVLHKEEPLPVPSEVVIEE